MQTKTKATIRLTIATPPSSVNNSDENTTPKTGVMKLKIVMLEAGLYFNNTVHKTYDIAYINDKHRKIGNIPKKSNLPPDTTPIKVRIIPPRLI